MAPTRCGVPRLRLGVAVLIHNLAVLSRRSARPPGVGCMLVTYLPPSATSVNRGSHGGGGLR